MISKKSLLIFNILAFSIMLLPFILINFFSEDIIFTLFTQFAISAIACLSYNILLGQTGLLSFGHAIYSGAGAFFVIHLLSKINSLQDIESNELIIQFISNIPLVILPLFGGVIGAFFSILTSWIVAKHGAMVFAMITLGLGELVYAISLMLPQISGGDLGISADRTIVWDFFGINFSSNISVYLLSAIYAFTCALAIYLMGKTPLGMLLTAVRDNSNKLLFLGYRIWYIKYLAMIIAGFFAGISGGLSAIWFEVVTTEVFNAQIVAGYLLFTFLGGVSVFYGAVIGAFLMVISQVWLSEITPAWQLYLGLLFILAVIYFPKGIAGLIIAGIEKVKRTKLTFKFISLSFIWLLFLLCTAIGVSAIIEITYNLKFTSSFSDNGLYNNRNLFLAVGIFLISFIGLKKISKYLK